LIGFGVKSGKMGNRSQLNTKGTTAVEVSTAAVESIAAPTVESFAPPASPATPTTPTTTTPTVEARLARLERSLRLWKLGTAAAVLAMVGMGATEGAKVPDEIRAKCFVVENYDGQLTGIFGYIDKAEKAPALILTNNDKSASFAVNPNNPKIKYTKPNGETVYIE